MRRGRRPVRASDVTWDDAYDVVVIGAGAAGFPAALNAAAHGSSVVILEKAAEPGGTMKKSAAWYWIPNNTPMREDGLVDDKEGFLRYCARLARPQVYDAAAERYGLSDWEHATVSALYDNAAAANDRLAEIGAIKPLYSPAIPDYHSTLPEASAPFGRTLQIDRGDGEMGKGDVLLQQFLAACDRYDVPVLTEHRAQTVVLDDEGAVVGVRVVTPAGEKHVQARQAAIFATGGFTHDAELRRNFLPAAIFSGCAARSNEGDFVHIASALGLPLRNMNNAWLAPIPLEIALQQSPYLSGMFAVPGDSMIWVDKYGKRVVNEKTIYNELAMSFLEYDPHKLEYPRLLMFMVWDERTNELWRAVDDKPATTPPRLALDNYGNVIYDDFHVIEGETLADLAANVEARVAQLAPQTGGFALDTSFGENLPRSVARFNELAATGKDEDLHRGENPIELIFNGDAREGNETGNPTMHPIADSGPYYATIVCAGTLDTKGGPATNPHGQVLDADGDAVPGLYAAGNCVANASAQAYWAGGGTIGPYFTFAYLASEHAVRQPRREAVALGAAG
jgi:succinate dehydrogenase/fumarate reductase flavoprotein subunit